MQFLQLPFGLPEMSLKNTLSHSEEKFPVGSASCALVYASYTVHIYKLKLSSRDPC
jgi:hypothetical protein